MSLFGFPFGWLPASKNTGRLARLFPIQVAPGLTSLMLMSAWSTAPVSAQDVPVERLASGLNQPVFATHAPGDSEHLYVVSKSGEIRVMDLTARTFSETPLLTLDANFSQDNERGLLGLAFDPEYASNGYFYVNLTDGNGDTVVRRYTQVDGVASEPMDLISIAQPQSNHNGGWIGFNPQAQGDARHHLYVALGDGGGSQDFGAGHTDGIGNGQDITDNLLSTILRINVSQDAFPDDPDRNYTVPQDNPFVGADGDDEIFAYGLRNPWRASFDTETGDLWIGDVGQSTREEVDVIAHDSPGGENFGWRLQEGSIQNPGGVGGPAPEDHVLPVLDYTHGSNDYQGRSVTGGYVYRGPSPLIEQGTYVYADYVSDQVFGYDIQLPYDINDPAASVALLHERFILDAGDIDNIASFGTDAFGNLYLMDLIEGELFVVDFRVPGDANRDGVVDLVDLDALGAAWLSQNAGWEGGDFNHDGITDLVDLDLLGQNWGWGDDADESFAAALAVSGLGLLVPEPAVGVFVLSGGILFARRRRSTHEPIRIQRSLY